MKKFNNFAGVIIASIIFFTLGAGYPAAKTKWENWARPKSSGVSLECPDGRHSIKFYHAHGKFSTLSVSEGSGPDTVAIYVRHRDGRPMLQVVDRSVGKVYHIDLVALAKAQSDDDDRLPWGSTGSLIGASPDTDISSDEGDSPSE